MADIKSAQENFYAALRTSDDIVRSLRKARTGHPGGTQEMIALDPDTPTPPMQRPSQLRVRSDTGQFEAHLVLIERLLNIAEEDGEIVCVGQESVKGTAFCQGMKHLWLRAGKEAPTVKHARDLDDALAGDPLAIFIQLDEAPEDTPLGYIHVTLNNPDVCILFRGI